MKFPACICFNRSPRPGTVGLFGFVTVGGGGRVPIGGGGGGGGRFTYFE